MLPCGVRTFLSGILAEPERPSAIGEKNTGNSGSFKPLNSTSDAGGASPKCAKTPLQGRVGVPPAFCTMGSSARTPLLCTFRRCAPTQAFDIGFVLVPIGLLAANVVWQGEVGNLHAFDNDGLRVSDGLRIAHSPSPGADINFNLIGNFDDNISAEEFTRAGDWAGTCAMPHNRSKSWP